MDNSRPMRQIMALVQFCLKFRIEKKVIAYFSKVFSETEKNYCITRRKVIIIFMGESLWLELIIFLLSG